MFKNFQEPLGKLINSVGSIIANVQKVDEESLNPTVRNFSKIMELLCVRMGNCELIHFELVI